MVVVVFCEVGFFFYRRNRRGAARGWPFDDLSPSLRNFADLTWRFETTPTLSVPEMGPVTVRRFWMVLRVGVTVSTTGTMSFPPDRSLMPVIPRMAMAAAIMIFFLFGFLGFFLWFRPVGSLVLCRILLVRFFLHCSYSCVPSEVFYVKCDYFNTGI